MNAVEGAKHNFLGKVLRLHALGRAQVVIRGHDDDWFLFVQRDRVHGWLPRRDREANETGVYRARPDLRFPARGGEGDDLEGNLRNPLVPEAHPFTRDHAHGYSKCKRRCGLARLSSPMVSTGRFYRLPSPASGADVFACYVTFDRFGRGNFATAF